MQKLKLDLPMTVLWLILLIFGLMMIFSASSVMSLEMTDNKSMFVLFKKQLFYIIIGVLLAMFIAKMDYTKWKPYILWFNIITIVLLVLVGFTPLGMEVNGATRWINIGIQFQPSELAKVVIIITIASMIDEGRKYNELNKMKSLSKIGLYVMFYSVLIGIPQNHASVIMIIGLTVGLLLFFGGINKFLFFGSSIGVIALGLFVGLTSEFRRKRLLSFLDPLQDKGGEGYQITQNWYALGSGEFFGVGLGYGRQKFGWLPEDHTDFILSIIGEELGFIGVFLLLLVFFLFISRGLYIAINSKDSFGMLLTSGIIGIISIQVILNTAVISGLFPVTGVPLPFISYGGTYTIMMCAMVGIIFSVNGKITQKASDIEDELDLK